MLIVEINKLLTIHCYDLNSSNDYAGKCQLYENINIYFLSFLEFSNFDEYELLFLLESNNKQAQGAYPLRCNFLGIRTMHAIQ
jgi:hypothetical protein